jgi:hypothetical protein
VLVAPVAAVAVNGVLAENLTGVCVEHGDGVSVDEDCHRLTCMDGADAEVVHAAGAAEADFAEAVDVIIADAVVGIVALSRWGGLDGGGISMGRGGAMERTMRSDLVVDAGEAVELGLQLAMMAAAGRAASQAAPAATLGPDEGVKPLQHCPVIVECRIADQGGRNQLLRSNGLATHGHHRLLTLLTPLPQLILCSAALLPPLAFDCLALPPPAA